MKRSKTPLLLLIIFAALAVMAAAPSATPGPGVASNWSVGSPSQGVALKTETDESGDLKMLVAECDGRPLPGKDSIVASLPAPSSSRVHASRIIPRDRHWAVPSWPDSPADLPELTQYALWENNDGSYTAMINLTGGGMITYLSGEDGRLTVRAHSYMDGHDPSLVPLCAMAKGKDPYKTTADLYAFALKTMRKLDPQGVIGRPRTEKAYPEIFEYLGWCSWNAHYTDISAAKLLAHGKRFRELDIPVRWMIIDDGWEDLKKTVSKTKKKRGMSLAGFDADPSKFPRGLSPVAKSLKKDFGISWLGVWNTFNGYWNGVALDSRLGREYKDALMPINPTFGIPDVRDDSGRAFWEGYYRSLREKGVDFVKTDNQSTMDEFTENMVPVGHAYANGQRNFQSVAEEKFDSTVINCMSMNVDTIYQWKTTNIARVSRDFYPVNWHNPRSHTLDCVMNSLWFSNLAWPDYDMWQTHDQFREYHAVARAISGGPVYITDKLGQERPEHVRPLALADGRILRPQSPGLPARQSLFINPYVSYKPLVAFAKSGESGLVAVWNVDRIERPMRAYISPSDVEGISGREFAVYEYFEKKLQKLGAREKTSTWLWGWGTRLYSITPVKNGFAPLGLTDKYGCVLAVKDWSMEKDRASVALAAPGPFLAWSKRKPERVKVDGNELGPGRVEFSGHALRIDVPGTPAKPVAMEILWGPE